MAFFVINKSLLRELHWQRRVEYDGWLERHLRSKSTDELKILYGKIVRKLNRKYYFIKVRTRFEVQFSTLFEAVSRVDYKCGFWIGNACVDIYLPRYNQIIEIDGGVHNRQVKMLKDEFRDDLFTSLNLKVNHVENRNVKKFVNELAVGFKTGQLKPVDSRSLDRKLRRIYIKTLTSHKHLIRTELWN